MELRKTVDAGVVILAPDDPIFDDAVQDLESALAECLQAGVQKVVIDLSDVAFLDSQALEVLVTSQGMLRRVGGDLKLSRPSPKCRDILRVTRLDRRFDVHADRAASLRSFQ